jgi:predicted anti-sigma-YlaC factor YlaD
MIMTCKESAAMLAASFDENLSDSQRGRVDAHLSGCAYCRAELAAAQQVLGQLRQWQEQPVPQWERVPVSPRHKPVSVFGVWWQWAPLAASVVLGLAVLLNLQIVRTDAGMVIAFGAASSLQQQMFEERLAQFEHAQRENLQQDLQVLSARLEMERAHYNNGLMDTIAASNTRSLEQVVAYFEAQRRQDLQLLQSSYQQLAESDYQTIRSVQQLASYVQSQGGQL